MLVNRARLIGALSAAVVAGSGLVVATPASADPTPGYACVVDTPNPSPTQQAQPIQVCASFDKASYSSGDTVKATVSVTNLGIAPAPGVTIWPNVITGTDHLISNGVGPLIGYHTGPDIAPGSTEVSEVDGYATDPASGTVTFTAPVYQFPRSGGGGSFGAPVSITSSVTPAVGNYSGVIFNDANDNGNVDPGEGIAGVQVTLNGPFDGINGNKPQNYTATTDANGDFTLTGLPTGQYSDSVTSPSGWYIQPAGGGTVTVSTTGGDPSLFEATPSPVPLTASMSFDQSSYHAGDTVNVTLSLTNTSANPLYGVQAECDPPAEDGALLGVGNGWDQLVNPGITVPGNQTVTLHLTEILPVEEAGDLTGKYEADCVFEPFVGYRLDGPEGKATATILPPDIPTTSFVVNIIDDDPQNDDATLPALHLFDPATQDIVAGGIGLNTNVTVAQGTWDIAFGEGGFGSDNYELAPGQQSTLDTSTITPGQTVDIHVVPKTHLVPPAPPSA